MTRQPDRRAGRDDPIAEYVWGLIGTRIAPRQCSRTNANDRLPFSSLRAVEGGDGIAERRDGADIRPQPSVSHTVDDLSELGAIGLDNKIDGHAVRRPRLGWP